MFVRKKIKKLAVQEIENYEHVVSVIEKDPVK